MVTYDFKKLKQYADKTTAHIRQQFNSADNANLSTLPSIEELYSKIDTAQIIKFAAQVDIEHVDYFIDTVKSQIEYFAAKGNIEHADKGNQILSALIERKAELTAEYGYDTRNA